MCIAFHKRYCLMRIEMQSDYHKTPGKTCSSCRRTSGSFARAVDSNVPPCLGLSVGGMLTDDGRAAILSARVHMPALQAAFERHLLFGGLPAAVAEAAARLSDRVHTAGATVEPSAPFRALTEDA
jgi:hypothetical protein